MGEVHGHPNLPLNLNNVCSGYGLGVLWGSVFVWEVHSKLHPKVLSLQTS